MAPDSSWFYNSFVVFLIVVNIKVLFTQSKLNYIFKIIKAYIFRQEKCGKSIRCVIENNFSWFFDINRSVRNYNYYSSNNLYFLWRKCVYIEAPTLSQFITSFILIIAWCGGVQIECLKLYLLQKIDNRCK